MDILHLVDRLEREIIQKSTLIPLTVYRLVDEEHALELIDQMRISLPDEIKNAKRIYQERDRIIAQANEEASRLVELAQTEAADLVQRDAISGAADRRAQTIIERAQRDAQVIKLESDEYIMQVLSELEAHLMRSLTVVQNGLDKLEEDRQEIEEAAAVASDEDESDT
jgi:regulator of protease activity HflC (stomatin/prohibitin superfamily)